MAGQGSEAVNALAAKILMMEAQQEDGRRLCEAMRTSLDQLRARVEEVAGQAAATEAELVKEIQDFRHLVESQEPCSASVDVQSLARIAATAATITASKEFRRAGIGRPQLGHESEELELQAQIAAMVQKATQEEQARATELTSDLRARVENLELAVQGLLRSAPGAKEPAEPARKELMAGARTPSAVDLVAEALGTTVSNITAEDMSRHSLGSRSGLSSRGSLSRGSHSLSGRAGSSSLPLSGPRAPLPSSPLGPPLPAPAQRPLAPDVSVRPPASAHRPAPQTQLGGRASPRAPAAPLPLAPFLAVPQGPGERAAAAGGGPGDQAAGCRPPSPGRAKLVPGPAAPAQAQHPGQAARVSGSASSPVRVVCASCSSRRDVQTPTVIV